MELFSPFEINKFWPPDQVDSWDHMSFGKCVPFDGGHGLPNRASVIC